MSDASDAVVNVDAVEEEAQFGGKHWGVYEKALTPSMRPKGGRLGVNRLRVPPGRTAWRAREAENFRACDRTPPLTGRFST